MCRCLISVIDGSRSRFDDHMKNEHDVRFDLDSLLVLSVMTLGEKQLFTRQFDTKLKERICDKSRNPEKQDFEHSNVVKPKDDKINIIKEDQKLPPQAAAVTTEDKVVREGVLKCKLCPRYIKQSQMTKHKVESHNKVIEDNSEIVEKLLIEENNQRNNVELDQNIVRKKRTRDNSPIKLDNVHEKTREEEEDEDWTARSKRRARISCRYCSKKFGSKLSVTTHERKVHTGF